MSQTRSGKTYNKNKRKNNTNDENNNVNENGSQSDTIDSNTQPTQQNAANEANTNQTTPTPSQTASETQVTIPVVREATPPNDKVPSPKLANHWQFLDPTIPMRVKLLKNINIKSIKLPTTFGELTREHFVSYPEGMRFLMMGVQIPGVTQLDESAITDVYGKTAYITPYAAEDHEWLHILLKHPRDDKHNRWRTQLIQTPTVSSYLLLKALHLFQINYVLYAINEKGTVGSTQALSDLRKQWLRLPEALQQWILQLLAIRPDDPTTQLVSSHGLIRATDTTKTKQFFKTLGAVDYIFQTSEYWCAAHQDDYKQLPLYTWEAQVHDMELTQDELKEAYKARTMGYTCARTPEQKTQDAPMTPTITRPTLPSDRAPTVREARLYHRYLAQKRYQQQQGPPPPLPTHQPLHSVLYWDQEYEQHRTLQWRFEVAWTKASRKGTANPDVYNLVNTQVHAKQYQYVNQMIEALSAPSQPPTPQAYGPSRGQTRQPVQSTDPYTPPPQTPRGKTTTRRQRRPTAGTNTNASANTNTNTNANANKSTTTQDEQKQPPPNLPNGITPTQDEQKQPPQGSQTQQQRVRFDLNKNQTNYYSQYAQQVNPRWTQQPMYQNPTTSEQLASNIANAFANNTLPPRRHDTMPQAPTGTVQTPAPANTPVETRYQAIPTQPFANFSTSQLNSIDQILGDYGHNISSSTKQRYSQPSNINTSLASIHSIHSIHTIHFLTTP